MRSKKRFLALGLTVAMVSSMAVGAFAAGTEVIQERRDGDVGGFSGSGEIDVDGYLTKDPIVNSSGSLTDPSLPSFTGSETPLDTSSSKTDWGGETTEESSQLIITAPTYLSFQVAGDGEAANIQLTTEGNNVTGTILNQSCYIQGNETNKNTVPKTVKVEVKKSSVATGEEQFKVVSDVSKLGETEHGVEGVHLNLDGTVPTAEEFAALKADTDTELGILKKGTRAIVESNGAYAVNPSVNKIFFADSEGKATGVTTKFGKNYDESMLRSDYTLNMTYTYIQ